MKRLLTATLALLSLHAFGQLGSLDPTFNPSDIVSSSGLGSWNRLSDIVRQPDGKHILFGPLKYNGSTTGHLARIEGDGTLDPTFSLFGEPNTSYLLNGALAPDGKILVGGAFTSFNGMPRSYLIRLNADGSFDESFDATGSLSGTVGNIAVQPDGRILVSSGTVKRLESTGALDATFNGPAGGIRLLTALNDGRVLVDGTMLLHADGSIDGSYAPDLSVLGAIRSAAIQPDEKILIAGTTGVGRFLLNGDPDPGFSDGTGVSGGTIIAMAVEADGAILLCATSTNYHAPVSYDGNPISGLGRIRSDGTWQGTVTQSPDGVLPILIPQPDGRVLVGGSQFEHVNGQRSLQIALLEPDGMLSLSFNAATGFDDQVMTISMFTDDAMLVGGWFSKYNGVRHGRLIKLDASGEVDPSFSIGTGANAAVLCIAQQADGMILVGGNFAEFNGTPANRLVRLHPNGQRDESFTPMLNDVGSVTAIVVQADGKLVIGYNDRRIEPRYASGTRMRGKIARVNTDGSVDASFINRTFPIADVPTNYNSAVRTVVSAQNGDLWVGGIGLKYSSGVYNYEVVRLDADGQLDAGFALSEGGFRLPRLYMACVTALLPDAAGGVLVGGHYSYYGTEVTPPVRLDQSGPLDASGFQAQTGPECVAFARPLNGGVFTGHTYVDASGAPYPGFSAGTGYENEPALYPTISAIAFQSDGKAIVGGDFTGYDGVVRNRIARINLDLSTGGTTLAASTRRAYPVPSASLVYLPAIMKGSVHDSGGRCVMEFGRTNVLDISSLAPGVYVVLSQDATPVRIVKE